MRRFIRSYAAMPPNMASMREVTIDGEITGPAAG
jgi:hypothetical protein